MFVKGDKTDDGVEFCVLSRQGGGGACIAKTKMTLLVGVFQSKDTPMSVGFQNIGDCEKNVVNVAKILAKSGY